MRKFILGTDWWSDCDDAVAVRLLTRYAREGKIELLGVGINATMEYSAPSLRAFLDLDGMHDVPIGIDRDATDFIGVAKYQKRLAESLKTPMTNDDFPDAARLYRRLLAEAAGKVEIIEIGFLQVLRDLLKTEPDELSDLNGTELVRQKVARVWSMAGKWDKDGECEHNFSNNERSCLAGYELLETCPVPITFLGFEVGLHVITGGRVDKNDHLGVLMRDHGSEGGRHSWDPMLTLLAIIGDPVEAGYREVRGRASLSKETGANYFIPDDGGLHSYVIKERENKFYEDMIDSIL